MEKQQQQGGVESSCAPLLVSMNQAHILDQIYTLSTTQQVFLDPHHFLPPQTRLSHQYLGGAGSYFPLNFKLGLNEFCSTNDCKDNGGDANLLRESEQCEVPEAPETSLGMLHSWENPDESAIKPPPFWEMLPTDVSNKNSEPIIRQPESLEMNPKDAPNPTACLDSKRRVHFGELEAIYKPLPTDPTTQTGPSETIPADIPKKKRRKKDSSYSQLMSEFFGNLVKQVMEHQENMHKKFADVLERMDEERRGREEVWRNQEMAEMEERAATREREKALAEGREAMIVSYLEKLTGQRISLPTAVEEGF